VQTTRALWQTSRIITHFYFYCSNMTRHKNKTFATLLAFLLGGIGAHRFYLYGKKDMWGWMHFATLPVSYVAWLALRDQPLLFTSIAFVVSVIASLLEALVIGLAPDEKWDAAHNSGSGRTSDSGWPLAVLLVLTVGVGAVVAIATLARTFDLIFTGGSFG
jgi:TM2 domain-containing membrane protein YozV